MINYYDDSIWKKVFRMDKKAWSSASENGADILNSMKDAEKYTSALPEQSFYGLFNTMSRLADEPPLSLAVEHELMKRAQEVPEYKELQKYTENDEIASLLGTRDFINKIIQELPEETKKEMQKNQKAQQKLKDAQNNAQAQEGQGKELTDAQKKALEKAMQNAQAASQAAMDSLKKNENQIQAAMAHSLSDAKNDIKDAKDTLKSFGCGTESGNLTKKSLENLNKIRKMFDTKRLKRILDMIGSMQRISDNEVKKDLQGREQLVSYRTQDLNLEVLAPDEWLGLCSPKGSLLHTDFLIRMADDDLLHCSYEGEAPLGKGPMIVVKDTSGSMNGRNADIANALEFVLLNQALKDGRKFISIPFSSSNDWRMKEFSEKPSLDEILEQVSYFYGGGTDPYPPLNAALDKVMECQDYKKAGILVITDGEFYDAPKEFLNKVTEAKSNPGVHISAISLGVRNERISEFADKVVCLNDFMRFDQVSDALSGIL